jgi:hypothetical protein
MKIEISNEFLEKINNGIKEIIEEWKIDNVIEDDLAVASKKFTTLHSKYIEALSNAISLRSTFRSKASTLIKLKELWYRGMLTKDEMNKNNFPYDPFNGHIVSISLIQQVYLKGDQELLLISEILDQLENLINTTTKILENITWKHKSIENQLNFYKL